jgi:hypothetical protein
MNIDKFISGTNAQRDAMLRPKTESEFIPVGTAETTSGSHEQFTSANFRAAKVPPGTMLYIRKPLKKAKP